MQNITSYSLLPLLTLLFLGTAAVASAQEYSQGSYYSEGSYYSQAAYVNPPQNFCARITTTLDDTHFERLAQRKSQIDQNLAMAMTRMQERRAEFDALRAQKRSEADAKRAENIARLMALAGTSSAKVAAVNAFKSAIDTAVATRRASVDSAVNRFRTDQMYFFNLRNVAIKSAFDQYDTKVRAAISTAQTSCAAETPIATIRDTFNSTVRAAQEEHKTERTGVQETYRSQVSDLLDARVATVQEATNVFKAAAEAARAALRAAFNN